MKIIQLLSVSCFQMFENNNDKKKKKALGKSNTSAYGNKPKKKVLLKKF